MSKYPWRLDDEKLVYPFYGRALKAGLVASTSTSDARHSPATASRR